MPSEITPLTVVFLSPEKVTVLAVLVVELLSAMGPPRTMSPKAAMTEPLVEKLIPLLIVWVLAAPEEFTMLPPRVIVLLLIV